MKLKGIKKRPLVYTVLSILFILEPVIKVAHLNAITGFTVSNILETIFKWNNKLQIIEYLFLFPFAGVLLFKVRKWSFILLMTIQVYSIYKILTFVPFSWPYLTETPVLLLWIFSLINVLVVLYFVASKNREPFFNQKIRWWESKRRYTVDIPCTIKINGDGEIETSILNMSQTGAFVAGASFKQGDLVDINFEFAGKSYKFLSKAMSIHPFQGQSGAGVNFQANRFKPLNNLSLILKLKNAGFQPTR